MIKLYFDKEIIKDPSFNKKSKQFCTVEVFPSPLGYVTKEMKIGFINILPQKLLDKVIKYSILVDLTVVKIAQPGIYKFRSAIGYLRVMPTCTVSELTAAAEKLEDLLSLVNLVQLGKLPLWVYRVDEFPCFSITLNDNDITIAFKNERFSSMDIAMSPFQDTTLIQKILAIDGLICDHIEQSSIYVKKDPVIDYENIFPKIEKTVTDFVNDYTRS